MFGQIFQKSEPEANPTQLGGELSMKKQEPKQKPTGESKMMLATKAYQRMIKVEGVKRKDIIAEFINSCELTPAGAATYYTLIRKKLSKPE